ncbi:Hpt domain-containing protein [Shewanella frigidimarina]|uniref:HPt domain-containing protein n=1 Tax=Shewanella frigidimarina TaxID=56812 RepID=A0A119D0M0_SHEFR|nr:Hpt domain-containing protein [Shewanella frigidimarina]KVX03125.1 hypothetical protein AWJ07_00665 [Shewanella frigidimarina]
MNANKIGVNQHPVDETNKNVANKVNLILGSMTLEQLLMPFGGNDKFYRRLIKVFEKNLQPQLQNIDLMISQKNIKELLRLVHTLKGSSGTSGLSLLYQALCDWEITLTALNATIDNEVDVVFEDCGKQIRFVALAELSNIHALLAKDDVKKVSDIPLPAADYSVEEITLMLAKLKQHLQDSNLKALNITLLLQNKLSGHTQLEHDLTTLCDAVETLDFATALAALSSLTAKL